VKAAKSAKRAKHSKIHTGSDADVGSMSALVAAVSEMGSSRSTGQADNTAILERQVAVQEADLRLRTFQLLYSEGSSASHQERNAMQSSMRTAFEKSVLTPMPLLSLKTPRATSSATPSGSGSEAQVMNTSATFSLPPTLLPGDGTTGFELDLGDAEDEYECDSVEY
jgi:hypothetical protein